MLKKGRQTIAECLTLIMTSKYFFQKSSRSFAAGPDHCRLASFDDRHRNRFLRLLRLQAETNQEEGKRKKLDQEFANKKVVPKEEVRSVKQRKSRKSKLFSIYLLKTKQSIQNSNKIAT